MRLSWLARMHHEIHSIRRGRYPALQVLCLFRWSFPALDGSRIRTLPTQQAKENCAFSLDSWIYCVIQYRFFSFFSHFHVFIFNVFLTDLLKDYRIKSPSCREWYFLLFKFPFLNLNCNPTTFWLGKISNLIIHTYIDSCILEKLFLTQD